MRVGVWDIIPPPTSTLDVDTLFQLYPSVWLLDRKRIHGLFVEFLRFPIALRKDSISIPKTVRETLSHLDWRDAMIEEMTT
ncbi:disease resistance protein RPM1 [Gossypium australe]|uniref:Disease resistance protein RPM1 n=1 Tax=Gossypium australe TaxID=47621 RepID=A0A5B6WG26_9ROSI|nr:disease resistance protein RPM1 [Gossypium australe]